MDFRQIKVVKATKKFLARKTNRTVGDDLVWLIIFLSIISGLIYVVNLGDSALVEQTASSDAKNEKLMAENNILNASLVTIGGHIDALHQNYSDSLANALLITDAYSISFNKAQEMHNNSMDSFNNGDAELNAIIKTLKDGKFYTGNAVGDSEPKLSL